MSLLDIAISVAVLAHTDQVDKAGEPYIWHPLRVAQALDGEAQIVGLLHDVLEDSDETAEGLLLLGFPFHIVDAVVALTRQEGERYWDYLARVRTNELATVVKRADLTDNLAPTRQQAIPASLQQRYRCALWYLADKQFEQHE